jgi:hypothetical protein
MEHSSCDIAGRMALLRRILTVSSCTLYILQAIHVSIPDFLDPNSFLPYHFQDKTTPNIPLRLLDCLGLTILLCFLVELAVFVVVVGLGFFGGGGGGFGEGLITGFDRKAVGDGIVIVSIFIVAILTIS